MALLTQMAGPTLNTTQMKPLGKCVRICCVLCVIVILSNFLISSTFPSRKTKLVVAEKKVSAVGSLNNDAQVLRTFLDKTSFGYGTPATSLVTVKDNPHVRVTQKMPTEAAVTLERRAASVTMESDQTKSPLLTFITTWPHDPKKEEMHNITMRNWMSFHPKIRVVVFANDSEVIAFSRSLGIKTFPVIQHAGGGAPVLRAMFETTMSAFNDSAFFGYVNADIVFTESLINTLETVFRLKTDNKPLLLVGQRTNVMNVTFDDIESYEGLAKVASSRGHLFSSFAEDYFITNRPFPWHDIADVVVGRRAYDNWLVVYSICKLKCDVIDATKSLLAVHQTTPAGGNFEGSKHKDTWYNHHLLNKLKNNLAYVKGYTDCTPEQTVMNETRINVVQRDLRKSCLCRKKT